MCVQHELDHLHGQGVRGISVCFEAQAESKPSFSSRFATTSVDASDVRTAACAFCLPARPNLLQLRFGNTFMAKQATPCCALGVDAARPSCGTRHEVAGRPPSKQLACATPYCQWNNHAACALDGKFPEDALAATSASFYRCHTSRC